MEDSRGLLTIGIERLNAGIPRSLTRLVFAAAASLAVGAGCGTVSTPEDDVGDESVHATLDWEAADPAVPETRAARLGQALPELVEQSEQIMHGEVVEIAYATSEDLGPDTLSFPHTFVTLRVDDPIKGGQPGDLVTLRFGGGPTDRGSILTASDIPLFGVGDPVVLFVEGNGHRACPLVGCSDGLVRISAGRAYDAHGTELFVDADGTLRAGAVRDIPEATEFTIGDHEMRLERDLRGPGGASTDAMPASELVAWLDARVGEQFTAAELAMMPSVASEDPTVPFVIEHTRPGPPRMAKATPRQLDEADRAEFDALRANGFNPVLPR